MHKQFIPYPSIVRPKPPSESPVIHSNTVECFLEEIISVYRKWGLSISHEDGWGAFLIERYSKDNVEWLLNARNEVE